MQSYGQVVSDELRTPTDELRRAIPEVYRAFKELHDAALAPGALDSKTKELIALAIAVSKECDRCIAAHAHAAVRHGASPQEAAEAIGVTFLMNGGPATRAYAAFVEFHAEAGQEAARPGVAAEPATRAGRPNSDPQRAAGHQH